MSNAEFVYVTFIKTTPEKLWAAITNPEFRSQYWTSGIVSDWKTGSNWHQSVGETEKTINLGGKVLESDPPKRLVLTWVETANPEDDSQVAFTIDAIEDMVRLQVIHNQFKPDSTVAGKVATGWPRVLSSLKTLLETGAALNTWAGHAHVCSGAAAK